MESRARRDMDPAFTWDLTPIFKDYDAWLRAYAVAEKAVQALASLPGTLSGSKEALKRGLDVIFEAQEQAERVYAYAFLAKSSDNGEPRFQEMEARAVSLLVALETATAFVNPEILSIPEDTLAQWLVWEGLGRYRHIISDVTRRRSHTLDAQGERLLAQLGDVDQTPGTTFEMFESVDMRFPAVHDEMGQDAQLTHGSFTVFRESRSQDVRREAFETYFGCFAAYINTLACVYGGAVKLDCFHASALGLRWSPPGRPVRQQRARGAVRQPDRDGPRRAADDAGVSRTAQARPGTGRTASVRPLRTDGGGGRIRYALRRGKGTGQGGFEAAG